MFAERNIINRRNVKTDTHHSYSGNKQMFLLSVRSRIVVSTMQILGLETLDGNATKSSFPRNTAKDISSKKRYINKIASQIVDMFVIEKTSHTAIIDSILDDREKEQLLKSQMTVNGQFPCRNPGCPKTFK